MTVSSNTLVSLNPKCINANPPPFWNLPLAREVKGAARLDAKPARLQEISLSPRAARPEGSTEQLTALAPEVISEKIDNVYGPAPCVESAYQA
jgi:hypothetical protein